MGREWELSFRLGMRPWIAVAYSVPVAAEAETDWNSSRIDELLINKLLKPPLTETEESTSDFKRFFRYCSIPRTAADGSMADDCIRRAIEIVKLAGIYSNQLKFEFGNKITNLEFYLGVFKVNSKNSPPNQFNTILFRGVSSIDCQIYSTSLRASLDILYTNPRDRTCSEVATRFLQQKVTNEWNQVREFCTLYNSTNNCLVNLSSPPFSYLSHRRYPAHSLVALLPLSRADNVQQLQQRLKLHLLASMDEYSTQS